MQFLAGIPFTPKILRTVYEKLTLPVLVLFDCDAYVSFDRLGVLTRSHPNWRAERIGGTRGLPHFDKPEETVQALEKFWDEVNTRKVRHAGWPALD